MLILQVWEHIVVFLDNPKCGSTTFREFIYPQLEKKWKVIFKSSKSIKHLKYDYTSPKYFHAPLSAAVIWLQRNGFDPLKAKYIATIREPLNRVIATYHYDLPKKKGFYGFKHNASADFVYYFFTNKHLAQFSPAKWRSFKNFRLTDIIQLETFEKDLNRINDKYGLELDLSHGIPKKRVNKNKKQPITVSEPVRKAIYERYKLDYDDTSYPIPFWKNNK